MGTVRVDPTVVAPGSTSDAIATGYKPKTQSRFELAGKRTALIRSTAMGSFSHATPAAPLVEGVYTLRVEQRVGNSYLPQPGVVELTVRAPVTPPADPLTISGVVVATSQTGLAVKWSTNRLSTGRLSYRKSGTTTWTVRQPVQTTPAYGTTTPHQQDVQGLVAGTSYDFLVEAGELENDYSKASYTGTATTLSNTTPPPPSGDLPPPPSGQDAAPIINAALATRNVRLQNGATYVCRSPLRANRDDAVLDENGATVLYTFVGDGVIVAAERVTIGGGTLQGGYTGTGWADGNHGVNLQGGGGHRFPDLWIRDFQGDAYYMQPSWRTGVALPGSSVEITGGGVKHVGRMGIGVVHFDGGHIADWYVEDCYTPLDFEPDANDQYSASARHWLVERVRIRGKMTGSDGSGSPWLQIGSPILVGAFHQRIEDIEVRYVDVDVTSPTTPHNALSTGTDGSFRPKDLRIHHNTVKQTYYRAALIEHTDGVLLTDNVTPVRSVPWAVLNDCRDPITVARNV